MPNVKTPFKLSHKSSIEEVLSANQEWRNNLHSHYPSLFDTNGRGQSPHTFFICCADSRYNETCLGVNLGEVFTYKNIGNLVNVNDSGCLSIIEFALQVLKVTKIIICGHTDCGAIVASMKDEPSNFNIPQCKNLTSYLQEFRELYQEHKNTLSLLPAKDKASMLAIANVKKQYSRLLQISTVQKALENKSIEIYLFIYNVGSGRLQAVPI